MLEETEWIKNLLPKDYVCEPRKNGVHCYSDKGISYGKQLKKRKSLKTN